MNTAAIILAAGKGERMQSDSPKVLHKLAGRTLLHWVLDAAAQAGASPVIAVTGYRAEEVNAAVPAGVKTVLQQPQLGTGHALACAKEAIGSETRYACVLCGDVPLIRPGTIQRMVSAASEEDAGAVLLTFTGEEGHQYGRIIRDENGSVRKIVEYKDAGEEELEIREANSGTYVFRVPDVFEALDKVGDKNAQGEYYLTDAIEILLASNKKVLALGCESSLEVSGVNSIEQLAALEEKIIGRPS